LRRILRRNYSTSQSQSWRSFGVLGAFLQTQFAHRFPADTSGQWKKYDVFLGLPREWLSCSFLDSVLTEHFFLSGEQDGASNMDVGRRNRFPNLLIFFVLAQNNGPAIHQTTSFQRRHRHPFLQSIECRLVFSPRGAKPRGKIKRQWKA